MSDRFARIERLYHAARVQTPEARDTFLAQACGTDDELRSEVESLLRRHDRAPGFLPSAVIEQQPALVSGTFFGTYRIVEQIGVGGMGEVYRAHDTKLGRDVALKVLPQALASDRDRIARLEREARLLASLNHANIAQIHGLEEASGQRALVMELVDGRTLAERIAGPLPINEALAIARQMCEALEAAHEHGIVHRDLKPANVKVRHDGTVKVLDFGLAKAAASNAPRADLSNAPTMSALGRTEQGLILGTPAYMSPEQARGTAVDKRTDIWAFGCILYEMLTGRRAFGRATLSDTIAAVLEREPDWGALPQRTPESLRRLLRRCLQRDLTRRLADIRDARLDLEDASHEPSAAAPHEMRAWRGARLAWVSALVLVTVIAGEVIMRLGRGESPSPPQEVRFDIPSPPTQAPDSLAMSPDGRTIVFAATVGGVTRLWARDIDTLAARVLEGTDGVVRAPCWSPDRHSVAFLADGKLKRMDVSTGTVLPLADVQDGFGCAWNRDGIILFNQSPGGPLLRVSDTGGASVEVIRGASPGFPRFLPDGRHFVYSANPPGVYLAQLDRSGQRRLVDGTYAEYTPLGYLLSLRDRTLFAQSCDPVGLNLTGSPVQVAGDVLAFSTSGEGSLAYRSGPEPDSQLVWFDRSGREVGRASGPGLFPTISPDGRRVTVVRGAGLGTETRGQDVWVLDVTRNVFSRLTTSSGGVARTMPVWSPDSQRVIFALIRDQELYEKPVSGGGTEKRLLKGDVILIPNDWSPDGRFLIYRRSDPKTGLHLWALSLADGRTFPVVQPTSFAEREAQFSPDGQWFAYESNESGRYEIYLRPFPDAGRTRVGPISTNGGTQVRWRRDGKELFYLAPDNRLMAVPIRGSSDAQGVEVGTPVALFRTNVSGGAAGGGVGIQQYAVSPDGNRFLINTTQEVTSPITVILHWKPRS